MFDELNFLPPAFLMTNGVAQSDDTPSLAEKMLRKLTIINATAITADAIISESLLIRLYAHS